MQKKNPLTQTKKPVNIHEALGTVEERQPAEDFNTIRISENVVASVTRKYVLQIDGVVRFASGSLVRPSTRSFTNCCASARNSTVSLAMRS